MTSGVDRQVFTTELRQRIAIGYPPDHPLRRVVENLPDTVSREEYVAILQLLLPLTHDSDGRS